MIIYIFLELPTLSHLNFPATKIDKLVLNTIASFTCRVTDVYPKPKLTFTHPTKNLNDSTTLKDISNTKHREYYPYSISAMVNFTVDYTDNNKFMNCTVQSYGSNDIELTKSFHLQVHGTQIIENRCANNAIAKKGETNFEISCGFFSNPREYIEWSIQKSQIFSTSTSLFSNPLNIGNSEDELNEDLILREGDTNEQFTVIIEDCNDGIYNAKLKFNRIDEEDFRNYKLRIGSLSHTIRLVSSDTELAKSILSEQDPSLGSRSHSEFSFLLINITFYYLILRR